MTDHLSQLWSQLIDVTGKIVSPDWGALINLLPIFLIIGVLGPIVTLLAVYWFVYIVRTPRTRIRIDEGPRPATVDPAGNPEFPPGEPYCLRDRLIYPPGTTRCDVCHDDLAVRCPMCGIGRSAAISTCGNCGLVLHVERRVRVARPAGPPPGGAAIA